MKTVGEKRKRASTSRNKRTKPYTRPSKTSLAAARVALARITETKYFDLNPTLANGGGYTANASNPCKAVLLNGIVQGTDNDNRIGRNTETLSIQLIGEVLVNTTALNQVVRIAVFYDKSPSSQPPPYNAGGSGTVISPYVFLGNVTSTQSNPWFQNNNTAASSYLDPRNVDYTSRFRCLMDERIAIDAQGPGVQKFDRFIKTTKDTSRTTYDLSNAGTIADITTGAYWLVMYWAQGTNSAPINWSSRLRYKDI